MPYEISYKKAEGGVIVTYFGVVTDETLVDSIGDRFPSEEAIKNTRYFISDFTDVTEFQVTPKGIKYSASAVIEASKINRNIFIIGIIPDNKVYGMARMWQAYTEVEITGWETIFFKTNEEAEVWLAKNL